MLTPVGALARDDDRARVVVGQEARHWSSWPVMCTGASTFPVPSPEASTTTIPSATAVTMAS